MPRKKQESSEDESLSSSESEEISSVSEDSESESSEAPKKGKRAPAKKKAPAKNAAPGKKRGTKRKKDPNAPKKKQSAYMYFLADNRERIKNENPGITFGEIGRKAGQMWTAMSDSEKEPYNAKAQKDKARYEKEMKTYTPPSDDESDDERPTKKRKVAKKKKDPNAPKNPMNAYFFYVKENRDAYKAKHSDLKMTEITKALGSQWKEMSESERAPYQKLADADKERFKKEKEEYDGQ